MIILDTVKLVEIYVKVDDLMLEFEALLSAHLLGSTDQWRGKMSLALSDFRICNPIQTLHTLSSSFVWHL